MAVEKDWFRELVDIMARLRAEDGCPWDRRQTHESLERYLLEECAELVEAIESADDRAMCDELGDVLLQVVFHAQIAADGGRFTIEDVVRTICEKLIRRHPHVFGQAQADTAEEVLTQWEKIKDQERVDQGRPNQGALAGVPRGLPALHRAYKVQKKAAQVGFDWPSVDGIIDKVREELDEVCAAMVARDDQAVAEEIGDLLFSVTNLSRFLGHFPEDALHGTVRKFERRFGCVEQWLAEQGKGPADCNIDELEVLWQRAKKTDQK